LSSTQSSLDCRAQQAWPARYRLDALLPAQGQTAIRPPLHHSPRRRPKPRRPGRRARRQHQKPLRPRKPLPPPRPRPLKESRSATASSARHGVARRTGSGSLGGMACPATPCRLKNQSLHALGACLGRAG
jgi:hypothetical protein